MIHMDDARRGSIDHMPFCASMAATAGTTFSRSWVDVPVCGPARISLLTGQSSATHGILRNGEPQEAFGNESILHGDLLGGWLRDAGWTTGMVGKYAAIVTQIPGDPDVGGWDLIEQWMGNDSQAHFTAQVWDGTSQTEVNEWHHERQARRITDLVVLADGGDWFAYWPTSTPHWPWAAGPDTPFVRPPREPQPAQTGTDWPPWITDLDPIRNWDDIYRQHVAQVRELRDLDRWIEWLWGEVGGDDVTVIITSDNGRHVGDHRLSGPGTKNTPYDEAARVPMLCWGPGFPPGRVVTVPAVHQDVTATVAAIAGATPALDDQAGIDLRAIARKPRDYSDQRPVLLQRREVGDLTVPDGDGVVVWPYKLLRWADQDPEWTYELYDLDADPGEVVNLADGGNHPSIPALDAALDALLDA